MKVAELTAFVVQIPLRNHITHASHTRTSTENLVVKCVLEDGTEGFGEGVPREYVTGETVDAALDLLRRSDLAGQFTLCRGFAEAVAQVERFQLAPVPGDERNCQGNAARCAVELALLDAYGKKFGEPVSAVTKLLTKDLHQHSPHVRYSGAIMSANSKKKLFLSGFRIWVYGFRQVKVKVGIAGHNDVYRLGRLRRHLGKKITMRVDANESWRPEEVVRKITEIEPFGVKSVEQPVPHAEVHTLAEARKQVSTPIMLDESLCSRWDAEQAIEKGTCDLFNLRLSKCGGFVPTLRLAQLAKRHGLGYQLGCQVGETALLSAAGRHFASSVKDIRYLEGSYDRWLVRERLGVEDITFGWGGWAPALTGPGLGVRVDPEALQRVTIRQEKII